MTSLIELQLRRLGVQVTPLLSTILLILWVGATRAEGQQTQSQPGLGDSRALARIADDHWQHQLGESLALRLRHGLRIEHLPDVSFEHARLEAAFAQSILDRLSGIDRERLGPQEQLSLKILQWEARQTIEELPYFWHLFQITPYSLPLRTAHQALTGYVFKNYEDLAGYLVLLRQYRELIGTLRDNLATQQAKDILLPKAAIDPVAGLLRSFVQPPQRSLFYVAAERLKDIDLKQAREFSREAEQIVADQLNPALENLAAALTGKYREQAPDQVGIGQYPGGSAAYELLVRYHTTLEESPAAIHQRGLQEVERLSRRMADVRRQLGFEGSQQDFHQSLRTDPRFIAKTPEQVGERLLAAVRRIEPKISDCFLHTPRASYGVERLDPALEGSLTYGYYEWPTAAQPVGRYLYNGSKLDQRPLVNAAALIYHELVPGHHFQIALQGENEALPDFRREIFHTAFVEGWAEYASNLGLEMSLYQDPYDLYGRLLMDMFLSVRLVVDTGMNSLGWSRQRAVEFMKQNVLESDTQIDTETLRYSTDMPAQALAYKIGSAKLWQLRQRAEKVLGEHFDIRRFHEAVLSGGSMPLTILEWHIDRWLETQQPAQIAAPPL